MGIFLTVKRWFPYIINTNLTLATHEITFYDFHLHPLPLSSVQININFLRKVILESEVRHAGDYFSLPVIYFF